MAVLIKKAPVKAKAASDLPSIKPPLGLKPLSIFELEQDNVYSGRLVEILEAIIRVVKADYAVPYEWIEELDTRIEAHSDRPDTKSFSVEPF